jgi:superfamily II DNA/RNA helicase
MAEAPAPAPGAWGDAGAPAADAAAEPSAEAEAEASRAERAVALAEAPAPEPEEAPAPEPEPEPETAAEPEAELREKKESAVRGEDASIIDGDKYFAEMAIPDWCKDLCRKKNYAQPTTIQALTIEKVFAPDQLAFHILGQAPTGSGKTLCFVLALLRPVYDAQALPAGTSAVCIMPTQELAVQMRLYMEAFEGLFVVSDGKTPPEAGKLTIRMLIKDENRNMKTEPPVKENILIGTPGTILSFGKKKLLDLRNCTSFVLDEADDLLAKKMETQVKDCQKLIEKARGKGNYNMLFFSATFTEGVVKMCKRMAPGIHLIQPTDYTEQRVRGAVRQVKSCVESVEQKVERLIQIFPMLATGGGQTLVFVDGRKSADDVARQLSAALESQGYTVESLTGQKTSETRARLMDQFRTGATKFLIATDVLCRGINVPAVNFVIHYDLAMVRPSNTHSSLSRSASMQLWISPLRTHGILLLSTFVFWQVWDESNGGRGKVTEKVDLATYLHRSGRCARFTNKGVSLCFYTRGTGEEQALQQVRGDLQASPPAFVSPPPQLLRHTVTVRRACAACAPWQVEKAYCGHMEGAQMEEITGDAFSGVADLLAD